MSGQRVAPLDRKRAVVVSLAPRQLRDDRDANAADGEAPDERCERLNRLRAAYNDALGRALSARDENSTNRAFDEADRLQSDLIRAGRRLHVVGADDSQAIDDAAG